LLDLINICTNTCFNGAEFIKPVLRKFRKNLELLRPIQLNYKHGQNRQGTYNVTLKRVRVTIVAVENQLSITYSECVSVALVTQLA